MKYVIVILFLIAYRSVASISEEFYDTESNSRIVNGSDARAGVFPFQVRLEITKSSSTTHSSLCGGTLICNRYVLTAAHCLKDGTSAKIILGTLEPKLHIERGRLILRSTEMISHEDFNATTLANDIALIKLPRSVNSTDRIRPISLNNEDVGSNKIVTTMGWGRVSEHGGHSRKLQYINVKTISHDVCQFSYAGLDDNIMCLQGNRNRSSCNGDSGGSVVIYKRSQYILIGNIRGSHFMGCDLGHPFIAVLTNKYINWIRGKIGTDCSIVTVPSST